MPLSQLRYQTAMPNCDRGRSRLVSMLAVISALCPIASAQADVAISSDPTRNMTCSGGICAPTATDAVLNTGDLEALLASGGVEVTSTGSGVQANNIDVTGSFSWTATSTLVLDSHQSIIFSAAVSDGGAGGASFVTNDGGSGGVFQFLAGGSVSFSNLADALTINGAKYKLVSDIKSLASDMLYRPGGSFALANDIDAKKHGIYRTPPIPLIFQGSLTGLGHMVSDLQIADQTGESVGLISGIAANGTVSGLGLENIRIAAAGGGGGIAGYSNGTIFNTWVTGKITATEGGGIVDASSGTISDAWSAASIVGQGGGAVGGLVGTNDGTIDMSFSTGNVSAGQEGSIYGGLVGLLTGAIKDSYTTGRITATQGTNGGAVGYVAAGNVGVAINNVYTIGHVGKGNYSGGFIGYNDGIFPCKSCYWDTSTNRHATGVGYGDDTGIHGLTTANLQSGMPKGFSPKIWAENANVNNGLPYLIDNPPK